MLMLMVVVVAVGVAVRSCYKPPGKQRTVLQWHCSRSLLIGACGRRPAAAEKQKQARNTEIIRSTFQNPGQAIPPPHPVTAFGGASFPPSWVCPTTQNRSRTTTLLTPPIHAFMNERWAEESELNWWCPRTVYTVAIIPVPLLPVATLRFHTSDKAGVQQPGGVFCGPLRKSLLTGAVLRRTWRAPERFDCKLCSSCLEVGYRLTRCKRMRRCTRFGIADTPVGLRNCENISPRALRAFPLLPCYNSATTNQDLVWK